MQRLIHYTQSISKKETIKVKSFVQHRLTNWSKLLHEVVISQIYLHSLSFFNEWSCDVNHARHIIIHLDACKSHKSDTRAENHKPETKIRLQFHFNLITIDDKIHYGYRRPFDFRKAFHLETKTCPICNIKYQNKSNACFCNFITLLNLLNLLLI